MGLSSKEDRSSTSKERYGPVGPGRAGLGRVAQYEKFPLESIFLTAAGRLKRFSRHSACLKTKKSRNVNENAKDMNRRQQLIEQIYIVECSQRYSKHVKCRLEHFKRPAAVYERASAASGASSFEFKGKI